MVETVPIAAAYDIRVSWNANSESDLAGYKIYHGTASGIYAAPIDVGNQTSFVFLDVVPGTEHFFAVTAYDQTLHESDRSIEVSHLVPSQSGGAGLTDSDGDGLNDQIENAIGTNPHSRDSDDDGVEDGQEVIDGSNPLDQGSNAQLLSTRLCGEWNGFLGELWNILELVNMTSGVVRGSVTLYSAQGAPADIRPVVLSPGQQQDLLVHDFVGRAANAYGKVCLQHDGGDGAVDGRMSYYKPQRSATGEGFEFAFTMPFTNGKRGSQFVPFNTFQPSLAPADQGNFVANWIQITNLSTEASNGTLVFYNVNGDILGIQRLRIESGARHDASGHIFGANQVGFAEWRPDNRNIPFQLRNVRYLYDNPGYADHFTTAFQLEGMYGSGETMLVPVSSVDATSVLELSNVLSSPVIAEVEIYSESGNRILRQDIGLNAHASRHMILDEVLGPNKNGVAMIRSNRQNSMMAVGMQYIRRAGQSVAYMYGVPARQALGSVARGSYNTFIGQNSELWLMNASSLNQTVSLTLVRSEGNTLVAGREYSIPAQGLVVVPLNRFEDSDHYGVATVQMDRARTIVGWVLRRRSGEFAMPVPVR